MNSINQFNTPLILDRSKQPVFLRVDGYYHQGEYDYSVNLEVTRFYGIHKTNKGWWVISDNDLKVIQNILYHVAAEKHLEYLRKIKRIFLILDNGTSKKCWKTFDLALHSFFRRKDTQVSILKMQLKSAEKQLSMKGLLTQADKDKLEITGHLKHSDDGNWTPSFLKPPF